MIHSFLHAGVAKRQKTKGLSAATTDNHEQLTNSPAGAKVLLKVAGHIVAHYSRLLYE
ncbi:MAG: hypothetical protein ACYSR4_02815 [Planctomycetota bacterium]